MKVAAVRDISEQMRSCVTYAKSDASAVPRSGYSPMLRANNIGEHGLLLEDLIFVPNTKISPKQNCPERRRCGGIKWKYLRRRKDGASAR